MNASSTNGPYLDSTSFFVGSPESFSSQPPPRPEQARTPRLRPTTAGRSISTPLIPRSGTSIDRRVSSGVMSLQIGTPRPQHQWTLFGQLMENEGQLPTPRLHSTSTGRRRPTTPRRNEQEDSLASCSTPIAVQTSHTDPFTDGQPLLGDNESADFWDEQARSSGRTSSPFDMSPTMNDTNYDSDSDSDTSDDQSSPISSEASEHDSSSTSVINRISAIPILYRNVLKCSIAYFIASLFTFCPQLSGFIGGLTSRGPGPTTPFPSGHMVATM
jgi:hypothetical protein